MQPTKKSLATLYTGNNERVLKCVVTYNKYGGYCVPQSSCRRPAAQKILFGDVWEPDTIEYIASHAGNGDIVHAGTYFGDFLPALSQACINGAILWAFEPNPENYRCAMVTVEINDLKNVELRNAGLGMLNTAAFMQVYDASGRALGGLSRLAVANGKDIQDQCVTVDLCKLDDVIPFDRRVSVLQLDVEGFEQQALSGAIQTIRRCKPIIILENLPADDWLSENLMCLGYQEIRKLHANTVLRVKS